MFKKIGIVTALSAAFLFGTAFDTANAESNTSYNYKVYYSVNGENGSLSGEEAQTKINDLLNKLMAKYQIDFNQKLEQTEKPAQNEEPVQTEKSEQKEQPVVNEPSKEQAPVQAPEQSPEQAKEADNSQLESSDLSQFEQEVVDLTNQERAKNGLAPLKMDTELSKVAREKSRDMAANNYFDHNSPNYGSPFDMMKSFGIEYRAAGENIAKGQRTPEEVVNAWMNSEGHRANILNPNFTHIGVGYVEQGNYWTQQFIGK